MTITDLCAGLEVDGFCESSNVISPNIKSLLKHYPEPDAWVVANIYGLGNVICAAIEAQGYMRDGTCITIRRQLIVNSADEALAIIPRLLRIFKTAATE